MRRPSWSRRPALVLAAAAVLAAVFVRAVPASAGPGASLGHAAPAGASSADASSQQTANPDPPRPASCGPLPADQGGPDNEAKSLTGTFPWPPAPPGTNPENYGAYDRTAHVQPPVRPANWTNGGGDWKLTSARNPDASVSANPQELCGVEGNSVDQAWQVSTGRPSTVIAVTDSGIEWCDAAVVDKIYVNRAAVPLPENANGLTKPQLEKKGVRFPDSDPYDLDGSGVLNAAQYSDDPRISRPLFCQQSANEDFVSPEDLIRAFGSGHRTGPAGFTEAIAGWNFVDNNNDPYDDVHYGHGTGEAEDSTGAADTISQEVGACPNCMVLPIRVGYSFIAQANAFAQAVDFAVDSGASVIQEALGTYDVTDAARQAVRYATDHGVPVVASAADEEAEHHNLPAVLPDTIVVNSVTRSPTAFGGNLFSPDSYLYLNGCTNYGANISVAVESSSCSSEATGKTGGIVGLAESAASDAMAAGKLAPYPGLRGVDGSPVPLSANEITQLVTADADDVDFQTAAPPYPANNYAVSSIIPTTRYPTQPGFDDYTGYGRIDAGKILTAVSAGRIPPEADFTGLDWFKTFDPSATLSVSGLVAAVRAKSFHWTLQAAAGAQPEPGAWRTLAGGSGSGHREGLLARVRLSDVAKLFPKGTDLTGGPVMANGAPDPDKFSFTLRLVVTDDRGLAGVSRRTEYLHRDTSLLDGYPRDFGSSIDASPTLAPIGPHGTNALLVATSDGTVRALQADGRELPGWPVHTETADYHPSERAYTSGEVSARPHGTLVGGLAVGKLDGERSKHTDVVAADLEGRVYAWDEKGRLLPGFPVRTNPNFSSPAARDQFNRLQRGVLSAPALGDLTGDGRLDIVVAAMDRHVYAWSPDGKALPGWPVLVIDPSQVSSVDPVTNKVTFKRGSNVAQGTPLVDTPAIGRLSGSGPPDVVVASDEEYRGPLDANYTNPIFIGSDTANSRVYAIDPRGTKAADPYLPGWPVPTADLEAGLLPDVGDGSPGSPALADLRGDGNLEVGTNSAVGPAYVLNADGSSYLGNGPGGLPNVLSDAPPGSQSDSPVTPTVPSLASPVFAPLTPQGGAVSLVTAASSIGKIFDAALPASQVPNDTQADAWDLSSGQLLAAFPQRLNDNLFLGEPIVADVGGDGADPYVIAASGTYDLRAFDLGGNEAPGFPKFTGGWVVNAPSVGPFSDDENQVLALGTREGALFVWSTPTPSCSSSGPWPKDHRDLANSSDLSSPVTLFPRCSG